MSSSTRVTPPSNVAAAPTRRVDGAPAAVAEAETRDPAESLLAARTVEGLEEDAATPEELELLQRVREDRARERKLRRAIAVAGLAAIALIAALVWSYRVSRAPITASAPTPAPPETTAAPPEAQRAPADAPPPSAAPRPEKRVAKVEADRSESAASQGDRSDGTPPPGAAPRPAESVSAARELDLPPRLPRRNSPAAARQTEAPRPERQMRAEAPRREPPMRAEAPRRIETPRDEPAAMARPGSSSPSSDVRVQVAHAPSGGSVDYTVRVSWPDGAPMKDADVRVRGIMSDGGLVEARLDPGAEPGLYRGLLTFSPRGPRGLTVRVARGGALVEIPIADSPAGSAPRP